MSSSSSTAQALSSLLPSHPHPPKLTHLADSLLAQSRQRAPNLKPEEEIARSYACAEVACNRLRVELRLPASVKARPPCKPGVYKKLLAFLDGVLTAGGDQASTPTRRASGRGRGRGRNRGPEVVVDVPSLVGSRRKVAFTGRVEASNTNTHDTNAEAPAWTMPLIRKLCSTFSTPLMPPHVYTGLCVVLKLAKLWPPPPPSSAMPESDLKTATASLLIAIYLIVHTRMQIGDMTTTAYLYKCGSAVALAALDDEEGRLEVEEWIRKLDDNGWCEGQGWFVSVPEGVMEIEDGGQELPDRGKERRKEDSMMEDEVDDPEGVLLPGLGTMMQESVNWLSEERRSNHEKWRREILQRIGVR